MNETDFLIIGAGAAGLMCASQLANAGSKVIILEARNRAGGRIHTLSDSDFPLPVEAGAEFVHGDLPLTKQLLHEAALDYYEMEGDFWRSEQGEFIERDEFIEDLDLVVTRLRELEADTSIADFLHTHFSEEKHTALRSTLKNYIEGYDAADTTRASALALLQELSGEENVQYRIKGGYQKLIDHLITECSKAGCSLHLETIVKKIRWQKGLVEVIAQTGRSYAAKKVVITVPLGVLQSSPDSLAHISLFPAIADVQAAIQSLGYGNVIKLILHFHDPIWNAVNTTNQNKRSEPAFVFSDASIPTWWTQLPERNGMITGWLAGPKAAAILDYPNDAILTIGLESLSQIFNTPLATLRSRLISSHVYNWSSDDFSKGAYSYQTVDPEKAKGVIRGGVEDTLFFAGEAYSQDGESGTVEAALASGKQVAENILRGNN